MKHNKLFTRKTIALALLAAALLTTSCIRENLDECVRPASKLTLKVVNEKNEDITSGGTVKSAILYVFDEDLKLLEARQLNEAAIVGIQNIALDYPDDTKLHLVAWGNLTGENENVPDVKTAADLNIMLKTTSDRQAEAPDDLYYGSKEMTMKPGSVDEIVIALKVGQVSMTTVGLQYAELYNPQFRAASADHDYDFQLKHPANGYDYKGEIVAGDSVYYQPESKWDATATEWETPDPSNACEGENLTCSFRDADGVIQTVNTFIDEETGEKKPIQITPGSNTLIQFVWGEDGAFIGARVIVTPWKVVEDNPELKPVN